MKYGLRMDSMRCISSINTGSVFLFIQSTVVITLSFCCPYFSSLITPLRFAGVTQMTHGTHETQMTQGTHGTQKVIGSASKV